MTHLVIDANNVACRMFYGLPCMFKNHDNTQARTEVIFGFLREMISLIDGWRPCVVSFCFDSDSRQSVRRKILPYYKDVRQEVKLESRGTFHDFSHLHKQIRTLMRHILPELGFSNVFCEEGYEADDLIAVLTKAKEYEECLIVSSDKDLWQLLSSSVMMYDHTRKRLHTQRSFIAEWNILPEQWATVKAIAGCSTDGVPGIAKVGEKTAIKFMKGKLKKHTIAHKNISSGEKTILRNTRLVTLPFNGTPIPTVRADDLYYPRWQRVLDKHGVRGVKIPGDMPPDLFASERE